MTRRGFLQTAAGVLATAAFEPHFARAQDRLGAGTPVGPNADLRVTRLELLQVKPRWTFLKLHTNLGVVGLGPRRLRYGGIRGNSDCPLPG